MFESGLKALAAGLSIWESKEKTKYQDKAMTLRKAYYAEYNKAPALRSDAVLDNLEFELRVLIDSFASAVGASGSANIA